MTNVETEKTEGSVESYTVRPVGYVRSQYLHTEDVAHTKSGWTAGTSRICLMPKYAGFLGGLKGYSHIIVLFWVHRQWRMPKGHNKPPWAKVFATRMPARPNRIALSAVQLLEFSAETGELVVKGLDALDGTPVLDIKPYIPNFDSYPDAQLPDWVARHLNSHFHSGQVHQHDHGKEAASRHHPEASASHD